MRGRQLILALLMALTVGLLIFPSALVLATQPTPQVKGYGASIARAIDYLKRRQQSDGGFAEPGKDSSELLTMWAVCGVSAAGQDVNAWRKSGKSPLDYLASRASKLTKLTDLEKECLAVSSAGKDPRSFGGRNLVADIKARIAGDGHIGDLVNEHCWGAIALKAAGESLPDGVRTWLVARQNIDGGYGYGTDTGSDPDDTGAALQALIASGESPQGSTVKRAISYLHFCQGSDGGFAYNAGQSNVGSTAWVLQGIVASGQDPASSEWNRSGKTPLDYLASTQQSDGHFRYMKSSDANAAWMTVEVIPALLMKPFPLKKESTDVKKDSTPESTEGVPDNNTAADSPGNTSIDSTAPNDSAAGAQSATDTSSPSPGQSVPSESDAVQGSSPGGSLEAKTTDGSDSKSGSSKRTLALIISIVVCLLAAVGFAGVLTHLRHSGRGTA
jgi:hypothetical protein